MILAFLFYIVFLGSLAHMLYWLIALTLQNSIAGLYILWLQKNEEAGQEITVEHIKTGALFGAIFTIPTSVAWSLISGYLALLAIGYSGALDWHKWIFIVGGGFIAVKPTGGPDRTLQDGIGCLTSIISYVLVALILAFYQVPAIIQK